MAANLFGGARDLWHNTGGRQGDPAARQLNPLGVHRNLHRVAYVFKVVQWLAHAHQHDVGQQPRRIGQRTGHGPFAQIIPRHHHLPDNLGRGQVAHQFLRASVTEGTGQRAADLRADAQGAAPLFGDIHHLDLMAARDAHQIFARAVFGHLLGHDLGHLDHELLGQLGSEGF